DVLWQSIDDDPCPVTGASDPGAIALARRRKTELSADSRLARTGDEVLVEVRRAIGIRVIYHLEASAEVLDAARYHEDQASGFGEQFLAELDATIHRIRK